MSMPDMTITAQYETMEVADAMHLKSSLPYERF